ncbi:MAG TPA: DUF4340 domain-containing protein [Desulfobacteria bacterium]|nr:DUF4340 domain-containing protein [Desulfobacteria bacterium]
MNKKTLFILLVVLAVLAGVGRSLLVRNSNAPAENDVMGSLLFETLPANEIAKIVIERPNDSVTLVKGEGAWIVENRFGYPADFSKITDLIRKLKQTKVGRKFPATEAVSKRLSLMPPDHNKSAEAERGTRIRLKDKNEAVVVDFLLGSTRKKEEKGVPNSQFVMPGGGPDIYLVDQIFSPFETPASSWLKKSPVKVAEKDIQKISCWGPDGALRYTFERPEKGKDFALVTPPTKRPLKPSAVNRLAGALAGLEIEDVANPSTPPESLAKGVSPRIDFTLFDGITYHAYPGVTCSPGIPCYLRLQVDYQKPTAKAPTLKDEKESKESSTKKSEGALIVKAKEMNDRLAPWSFVVPQWQHQAFFTTLKEMLEDEKKK